MRCEICGSTFIQPNGICGTCGARSGGDEYAPPGSAGAEAEDGVDGYGLEPWEQKKWRVAGISWAAVLLASFVPPVGLVVGFIALGYANRHKDRPGNKAVAIAAIATAFYMALMILYVGFIVWEQSSRFSSWDDPYYLSAPPGYDTDPLDPTAPAEDPWAGPDQMEELDKLLKQIQEDAARQQEPSF